MGAFYRFPAFLTAYLRVVFYHLLNYALHRITGIDNPFQRQQGFIGIHEGRIAYCRSAKCNHFQVLVKTGIDHLYPQEGGYSAAQTVSGKQDISFTGLSI